MKKELLELTPTRYLCPLCGKWHKWKEDLCLGYYDDEDYEADLDLGCCSNTYATYSFYFSNDYLYYYAEPTMYTRKIEGRIPISSIKESSRLPRVTFNVHLREDIEITLGFEFEESDYNSIVKTATTARKEKEQQKQDSDSKEQVSQRPQVKENKEDTTMTETTKKTCIKTVLYEKSPKENLEILKIWAEKYKPTLKWFVPVGAVYVAYRILNSNEFDLSVNNIADTCEKKLGFKLELLENKKALKELMTIGGIAAGAYGAVKAASSIFGTKEKNEDIYVEEVEAGMAQLNSISKKFSWIQPKTEDMLPVAFSVILVYSTLHKPTFKGKVGSKIRNITEDWQIRLGTYADMAKLFIQDKFKIDLNTVEDKKNMRICGFLVAVLGVLVFLYGKEVLENRDISKKSKAEINKPVKNFVEQAKTVIKKIAPTMYTTLITMLVAKKILSSKEAEALGIDEVEDISKSEVYEGEVVSEEIVVDFHDETAVD